MTEVPSGVEQLADLQERLYRHVHPSWVKDAQPTSQAFKPTPKDDNKLSTARGTLTTAEDAFLHHTGPLGLAAVGTWAVTVAEVEAGPIPLAAYGDPLTEPIADPAHAYIEFPSEPRKTIETKAKLLQAAARGRGRLHPPPGGDV